MRRSKRFLSVLLALVLCLSMLPVNALALELPALDVLEDVIAVVEEEEAVEDAEPAEVEESVEESEEPRPAEEEVYAAAEEGEAYIDLDAPVLYGSGRVAVSNTKGATGEDILAEARKWANAGATYWSASEPWPKCIAWRTGYTTDGQTSFDCCGFISRVLNDVGFRGESIVANYDCVLRENYGAYFIDTTIAGLVNYGTDITAAVMKAKNGDYSELLPGDIIGWVGDANLGNHIIIYAGLNSSGRPTMIEFTGSGYYERVITSDYQNAFQSGARFAGTGGGGVPINETNFPDDIFRAYVQEEVDDDGDWMLSEDELDDIMAIRCPDMGITSLKGIEYFTELLSVNCSGNKLTELDVSNSPNLDFLYCDNNMLDSLDISNCFELVYLHCYNNCLESLDVSNRPELERVWCTDNNLVSLNVSNNPSLQSINCTSNNLASLDVSSVPNLRALLCDYNNLMSLDVSNNPELFNLDCDNNNLETLDISNNPNLKLLECQSNQLEELDISNCVLLESLSCSSNQLEELDISCNTVLSLLYCESNNLTVLDISNNPYLVDWVLNGGRLEREYYGIVAYGKWVEEFESIVAYLSFDSSVTLIDGIPDAVELVTLMKYVVGAHDLARDSAYDYNGDGSVDILDIVRVIRYLAGDDVELY